MARSTPSDPAPRKASTPARKSAPAAKKAAPAKKTAPAANKAVPAKEATKAAPPKKAAATKEAGQAKEATPAKEAARKAAPPAKKVVPVKEAAKATSANKATSAKKAVPAKEAPAKGAPAKEAPAKKVAPVKESAKKAAAPARAAAPKPVKRTADMERFFESQKVLLLEERETYTRQATNLRAEADQLALDREPGDVQFDEESGQGDSMNVERERDLALSAQALAAVEEIDRAMTKIVDGTYGICERCGTNIPRERLKALPYAALCVQCKSGGLSRR